jgi:competence protein ComEC
MLSENGGVDSEEEPGTIAALANARCSRDACAVDYRAGGRIWRIMATRSAYFIPIADLVAACRRADIVVSERWLPRGCEPRWLRLDRRLLAETGGVAISLGSGRIVSVTAPGDRHPWRDPPVVEQPKRQWRSVNR